MSLQQFGNYASKLYQIDCTVRSNLQLHIICAHYRYINKFLQEIKGSETRV